MSKTRNYISAKLVQGLMAIFAMAPAMFVVEAARAQSKKPSAVDNSAYLNSDVLTGITRHRSKVDISGSTFFTDFTDNVRITSAVPELQLSDTQSGGSMWRLMSGSSAAGSFNIFDNSTGLFRLTINGSGNVGIGTTTPARPLHVYFAGGGETVRVEGASNTNPYLTVKDAAGVTAFLQAAATGGGVLVGSSSNNNLFLQTNATTRLAVDTTGNIGIGTSSPAYKLDLLGDLKLGLTSNGIQQGFLGTTVRQNYDHIMLARNLKGDTVGGTDAYKTIGTTSSGWGYGGIEMRLGGDTAFYAQDGATTSEATVTPITRMLIQGSTGNVGIGTTSPYWKLSFGASGDGLGFYSDTTHYSGIRLYDAATGGMYLENYTAAGGGFHFLTSGSEKVTFTASGNVGIGTNSPAYKLDLLGDLKLGLSSNGIQQGFLGTTVRQNYDHIMLARNLKGDTVSGTDAYKTIGTTSSGWGYGGIEMRVGGDTAFYAQDGATTSEASVTPTTRMLIQGSTGRVGIGTTSPSQLLDVFGGNINVTSSGGVGGNITATGTINARYQDVAEWVPSSEQLSAGTVVVLDSTKSNQVTSSSVSYDTRVAGVVSEQPGIALGEKSEGKVLVATTGRVRVRVDATKGPIHVGDLLVTSDVAGVAMKSEPVNLGGVQFHRPGTLIGKALEPLEKGKGSILVLLSLQ